MAKKTVFSGDLTRPNKPNDTPFFLLADAQKAAKRATKLTRQLLTFSKGGEPVKESTSLPLLIQESVDFVLHGSKHGKFILGRYLRKYNE